MLDLTLPLAEGSTIDGVFLLNVFARVIHTSCAATLLGGAVYLRFVLAPAIDAAEEGSAERTLFAGRRSAWAKCVGAAAGLILISGFGYYILTVIGHRSMPGVYHLIVGGKMLLALVVITVASLIAGKTAAAEKVRAGAKGALNVMLAATLAIFLLGATAKTYAHIPKTADDIRSSLETPADTSDLKDN